MKTKAVAKGPTSGKLAKQDYKLVKVSALKPHPKNPRRGNVPVISKSIEANDFYGAVIVQKSTGFILAGNHRYKAAVEAGIAKIPVIYVDVDDAKATKILLADNRTGDLATYDDSALHEILKQVSNDDIANLMGTGYGESDIVALIKDKPATSPLPEFQDQVKVNYTCPKCSFAWS